MPIYEYQCKSCASTFEKMIRWSEADRSPTCPNCQSQDTHKKISNFASLGKQNSGSSTSSSSCGSSGRFS
jgi:putative FmdB family regulatory protein